MPIKVASVHSGSLGTLEMIGDQEQAAMVNIIGLQYRARVSWSTEIQSLHEYIHLSKRI